jgi:hypothetical protein
MYSTAPRRHGSLADLLILSKAAKASDLYCLRAPPAP